MKNTRHIIADVMKSTMSAVANDSPSVILQRDAELLCAAGLGPLASAAIARQQMLADDDANALLKGAALTSALIYKQTHDAVCNVITELNRVDVTPALLKGISVADRYYQPPSARIMGDVDLLIPADHANAAQGALRDMGYRALEAQEPGESHHHLPAMRHPGTGVIIEIHTALYSTNSGPAAFSPIDVGEWNEHLVRDKFSDHAHDVFHLGTEYQLAYTLMHWAAEHKWADGVFGILDFLLIAAKNESFDWQLFGDWMSRNDAFGACAVIMFTYLEQTGLLPIPENVVEPVALSKHRFGAANLRFACFLVDSFPMSTRKSAYLVIDSRAARAAWRSMFKHCHSRSTTRLAIMEIARDRFERITLNPLRLARRLKSNFN